MGALNMKYKKWNKLDKSKRSSCSPVAFKHGCLLETYLELWPKKSNTWAFVFFKKFQVNSNTHLDFKKCLQVFLLNGSFGDIEFYYFSVDQSWFNGIKWVIVNVSVSHSVVSDSLWPHGLYSLPCSSVHRIFQARTLEWVAISWSQ